MERIKSIFIYSLIIGFLLSQADLYTSYPMLHGLSTEKSDINCEVQNEKVDQSDPVGEDFLVISTSCDFLPASTGHKICSSGLIHENNLGFSIWQPPESF